jgi:uncharacterized protein YciI
MPCIFAGAIGKDDHFPAGRARASSRMQGRRDEMLYAVLFTDNPDRADARQRLMPDHLAFLDRNASRIHAAGPLQDESGAPAGGLWLVEADNSAAVNGACTPVDAGVCGGQADFGVRISAGPVGSLLSELRSSIADLIAARGTSVAPTN